VLDFPDVSRMRSGISLLLLLSGMAFPLHASASDRVRDKRPSAFSRNIKYGPLLPLKWGVEALGDGVDRGLRFVEQRRLLQQAGSGASQRRRIQPVFGGLADGAGVGGGLRANFARGGVDLDMSGRISTRLYQHYAVQLTKQAGSVYIGPEAAYRSIPQENFYGQGPDSLESNRSTFAFADSRLGWRTNIQGRRVRFRHGVWIRHVDIGDGTDRDFPTTQELFPEAEVEGGFGDSDWLTNEAAVSIDKRDSASNPRTGAAFDAAYVFNQALSAAASNYSVVHLAGAFYIPLSKERRHVIAVRSDLVHNLTGVTPFYAQPTLGGSMTLRGFNYYRFRDRDSLSGAAEYRYAIWQMLDAVLFVDVGQVYSDVFREIDAFPLKSSAGVGLRLNAPGSMSLRFDVAHSEEGTRVVFKYGPSW